MALEIYIGKHWDAFDHLFYVTTLTPCFCSINLNVSLVTKLRDDFVHLFYVITLTPSFC